jgi:hypothetical protein
MKKLMCKWLICLVTTGLLVTGWNVAGEMEKHAVSLGQGILLWLCLSAQVVALCLMFDALEAEVRREVKRELTAERWD